MENSTKFRNGQRLRQFLGGKTYDEAVSLATCMIINNSYAYDKLMAFVDEQHPSDENQAAYYLDTVTQLVVLTDEEVDKFARLNHVSKGYVRMCKLSRAIREIIKID